MKTLHHKLSEIYSFMGISSLVFALLLILASCGGGQATAEERAEVQELLDDREFQITNQWASPLRGSRVNLIGNPNFIRFKGDSVSLTLPYFGVRHMGGGYNDRGGIEYEGPARNLNIEQEEGEYILEFEGKDGNENLDFRIVVYPDGGTSTSVTSTQRDNISYQGEIEPLPEEVREF